MTPNDTPTPAHPTDSETDEPSSDVAVATSPNLSEVPDTADDSEKMIHSYKVELDVFEGPLDLLLYLVKRDEVDIYDIPIERITQQYMHYIETLQLLDVGLAGEFLVMAANLCLIKSRVMLPKHVQPHELEEEEEEDPRWDLIKQLIEYKKFKEAAEYLGEREEYEQKLYRNVPEKIRSNREQRPLSEDIGIFDLIRSFQNILDRFADKDGLGEIVDDNFTVSDKIDFLLETIQPGEKASFYSLFEGATTKSELIVTFLAVLELMKINLLRVHQELILGEIYIERVDGDNEGLYQLFERT